MADLFSEMVPTNDSIFSGIPVPNSTDNPQGTLGRFRRAQIAAVANLDVDNTPAEEIYDQFQRLTDVYDQNMELYGEGQAEAAAAAKRQQNRATSLIDLSRDIGPTDGALGVSSAISQATSDAINYDIEAAKEAALEQAAIDRITDLAASGDHTTAATYLNLMEHGSVLEQKSDFMTKQLILQREISRAQSEYRDTPIYSHVTNFLLSVIPFQKSLSQTGLVDIPEDQKGFWDWMFAGDRRRAEAATLWNASPEEFGRIVREQILPSVEGKSRFFLDTYQDDSEQLELLEGFMHTPRPLYNNAWNAMDNLGLLAPGDVLALTKIGRGIPNAFLGMGARRHYASMTARAARDGALNDLPEALARTGFETKEEIADALSPSIMKPQTGPVKLTGQALANEMLERADRIAENLARLVQTGRMTGDEIAAAQAKFVERELTHNFNEARVMDVDWSNPNRLIDNSQTQSVTFTLGRNKTDGWVRKSDAERYASETGFGDAVVEQVEGGQWIVKVSRNMPETGAYIDPLQVKTTNIFSRFLLGARQRSDEFLANTAQGAENARNVLLNDMREQLWKEVNVDPASKARVANMAAWGESNGLWFETVSDANMFYQRTFKRDITEKEWKSYNGLRDINDFDFGVRNDIRVKELQTRGLETVNIDTGFGYIEQANALVDEGMTRAVRGRVLNMADGAITNNLDEASRVTLRDKGFQLVHLDEPFALADGREITAVAVRRGPHYIRERLKRTQLPYRAGGHRIRTDSYFAKQAKQTVLEDGTKVWKNPQTFISGTRAEVDEWVDVMNRAREQFLKNEGDLDAIDEIFGGRPGYPTAEKFAAGFDNGTYSRDFGFDSLFDREMPAVYKGGDRSFMPELDEDGTTQLLRTQGRLYYGQKGDFSAVTDWRGEAAPVLDAYQAVNRAFINIANLSSFGDYKATAIQRWVDTFGKHLNQRLLPGDASAIQKFLDGKIDLGPSQSRLKNAAEDQRQIILRNLGWKTESDMKFEEVGRQFGEFLMGRDPTSVRHKVSRDLVNWFDDKNPLQSLRGFAFDLKLGLFNPVQMFLQAGTFLAISAIDPTAAGKAATTNPLLRAYLMKNGESYLNAMIKSGMWKASGFDTADEFEAFMKASKASGFLTINGSHSLANYMGPQTGLNLSDNPVQKIRETGRFFFNEGELINRMAAMRSAWDWTKAKYAGKLDGIPPQDFLRTWTGRSETLAFSMSRSSQAWWQQGAASIPTQFFSYQARMMEMMFGGQLTRAERGRLIASQFLLYGAAGIPLAPVVSDIIAAKTGSASKLPGEEGATPAEMLGGWVDRGSLDSLVNALGGPDVMIGERFGTGGWIGDTIGELFGFSKYGEQNTLDILGGASFSVASDVYSDFLPYLRYTAAESGGNLGHMPAEKSFRNLAMNVASVSNALKFMMIRNHGQYISSNGNVSADNIPDDAAWFVLLTGSKPGDLDDLSAHMSYLKDRDKTVKEAARVVEQYRAELFNRPQDAEEIAEEINLFVGHLDPGIRSSVLAQARQPSRSMLDSAEERINRIRSQEAMIEQLEGNQ